MVDVRNAGELDAGAIPGSSHIPLAELARRVDEVPADRPIVAYCAERLAFERGRQLPAPPRPDRRLRPRRGLHCVGDPAISPPRPEPS